jgi:hypothetical protein
VSTKVIKLLDAISSAVRFLDIAFRSQEALMRTIDWLAAHDPLKVVPWPDPVIDTIGYDPRSVYVERYWLSILGPSATFAARALSSALECSPGGVVVPIKALAGQLGLGSGNAAQSPVIARALGRLVAFELAAVGGGEYALRRRFPPLCRRQLVRLPEHLVALHRAEAEAAVGAAR